MIREIKTWEDFGRELDRPNTRVEWQSIIGAWETACLNESILYYDELIAHGRIRAVDEPVKVTVRMRRDSTGRVVDIVVLGYTFGPSSVGPITNEDHEITLREFTGD